MGFIWLYFLSSDNNTFHPLFCHLCFSLNVGPQTLLMVDYMMNSLPLLSVSHCLSPTVSVSLSLTVSLSRSLFLSHSVSLSLSLYVPGVSISLHGAELQWQSPHRRRVLRAPAPGVEAADFSFPPNRSPVRMEVSLAGAPDSPSTQDNVPPHGKPFGTSLVRGTSTK